MEVAKSWFRKSVAAPPTEIVQMLFNHFQQNIEFIRVLPELVTPLPESGGMRNHNVACTCMIGKSNATVCIEGKTDEKFGGGLVAKYYQKMKNLQESGVSTRVPERIEKLVTALVGTALQARIDHSELAILIIHEFHTEGLDAKKCRILSKTMLVSSMRSLVIPVRMGQMGNYLDLSKWMGLPVS